MGAPPGGDHVQAVLQAARRGLGVIVDADLAAPLPVCHPEFPNFTVQSQYEDK